MTYGYDDRLNATVAVYGATDSTGPGALRVPLQDCLDRAAALTDGVDPDRGEVIEVLRETGGALYGVDDVTDGVIMIVADWAGTDAPGTARDVAMRTLTHPDASLEHIVVPAVDDDRVQAVVTAAIRSGVECHLVPIGGDSESASMSEILERRAGEGEEWSGRPPLGFEVEAGELVEADDFGEVVAVLRLVQRGEISKRSAADELDCSRRTINRALDNPERYGLIPTATAD